MDKLEAGLLASQTPEGKAIVAAVIEAFDRNVSSFLNHDEVLKIISNHIETTFANGRHTKPMSKKHRERLMSETVLLHIEDRRTCVLIDFGINKKKRIGYKFATISHFPTQKGRIYVYRSGVRHPKLVFFTGHFFDRLIERNGGDTDRNQIIFDFINTMHTDVNGVLVAADEKRKKGMVYLAEGIGLGHVGLVDWKPGFGFQFDSDDTPAPERIPVIVVMTFVSQEMMFPEQRKIWELFTQK